MTGFYFILLHTWATLVTGRNAWVPEEGWLFLLRLLFFLCLSTMWCTKHSISESYQPTGRHLPLVQPLCVCIWGCIFLCSASSIYSFSCSVSSRELLSSLFPDSHPPVLSTVGLCCQCRRNRFDPWVRKSPGEGNGNLHQYSCLGNTMDRGALWATVHWLAKELDTIQWLNNKQ